jgi:hypothetical protein
MQIKHLNVGGPSRALQKKGGKEKERKVNDSKEKM